MAALNMLARMMTALTVIMNNTGAQCGNCTRHVVAPDEGKCEHCGMAWKFAATTFVDADGGIEALAARMEARYPQLQYIGVVSPRLADYGQMVSTLQYFPREWQLQPNLPSPSH